jgi:predicted outer membrane protein
MTTRATRWRAGAATLGLLLVLTGLAGLAIGAPAQAQAGGEAVETEYGPLGPGDRDLLVRVRYAGLWEVPAGQLAAGRGADQRVREIGGFIAAEHAELDERVREVAAELGVELPDQPMAPHQAFLDRLAGLSGPDFDLEFVQLLREAHGAVYPLIAYARAGTQNDLVRRFAATAGEFIGRHLDYLESTGMVDWFHIPPPPGPAGAPSRFLGTEPAGVHPFLIWLVLGAAAVAGAITVVRTVRPR